MLRSLPDLNASKPHLHQGCSPLVTAGRKPCHRRFGSSPRIATVGTKHRYAATLQSRKRERGSPDVLCHPGSRSSTPRGLVPHALRLGSLPHRPRPLQRPGARPQTQIEASCQARPSSSVLDDAKRLVLTDADFGSAYLTQGWARRFVQQLFSRFVVLFVGYSYQDLPLLYLARGISAAEDGPGRYAITPPENDTFWLNLGIKPAHYPLRVAPLARHGALGDCLSAWAETANLGSLGTEARIKGVVTSDRPLSIEDEDFLKHSLLDIGTLRYFTRHARDTRWLQWTSGTESFNAIFVPGAALSETSVELAAWFAEYSQSRTSRWRSSSYGKRIKRSLRFFGMPWPRPSIVTLPVERLCVCGFLSSWERCPSMVIQIFSRT